MPSPLVSVVIPSYNHAKFISKTIESVLQQTYQSFEIVIVDDGSRDDTPSVVANFADPRISFKQFPKNCGAAEATNEAIRLSSGEYVCLLNSDDYWELNKLEIQEAFMRANPAVGAVFSKVNYVDESGNLITEAHRIKHGDIFDQANRSRADWIRRFFFEGNCLCHPSVMIRRECYERVGLYSNCFRQLPDFEFWIRLVKKYDIRILENRLMNFRILDRGANASAPTHANHLRTLSELLLIADMFFDGMAMEDFKTAFAAELQHKDFSTVEEFEVEKALMLLRTIPWLSEMYNIAGYRKLFALLEKAEMKAVLADRYGIDDLKFHEYSSKLTAFSAPKSLSGYGTRDLLAEIRRRVARRGVFNSIRAFLKFKVRS